MLGLCGDIGAVTEPDGVPLDTGLVLTFCGDGDEDAIDGRDGDVAGEERCTGITGEVLAAVFDATVAKGTTCTVPRSLSLCVSSGTVATSLAVSRGSNGEEGATVTATGTLGPGLVSESDDGDVLTVLLP